MKDQPAAGAAVEAKRRPGFKEPWLRAEYVGPGRLVRFKGDREAVEAHKVRLPKERKAPRKTAAAPAAGPALKDPYVREAADGRLEILFDCIRCGEGPGTEALPWAPERPSHCKACLELAIAEGPPPPLPAPPPPSFSAAARPRAVARSAPPAESSAYLAWVRLGVCCNPGCGRDAPSDPHHEGAGIVRHGMGQKVPDHLTVSVCRFCHDAITGLPGHTSGCLPDPEATQHERTLILRSREETLIILRRALDARLSLAVQRLPQATRIDIVARALALVPEDVLAAALLGERAAETRGAAP